MKKSRSEYQFQINFDQATFNNLISNFLQTNGFTVRNKDGEQYFRAGDAMFEGYRYFNYSLQGQILTIYAWLKTPFGEAPVDEVNGLNMAAINYRKVLSQLFWEIEHLSQPQPIAPQQPPTQNQTVQPQVNPQPTQFAQAYQTETLKKQETMCEVGFWFSLIGLVISFFGFAYGTIIYAMDLCFAMQGLKTRKKVKAITAIILSVISIIIVGIQFILEITKA